MAYWCQETEEPLRRDKAKRPKKDEQLKKLLDQHTLDSKGEQNNVSSVLMWIDWNFDFIVFLCL